jgi:hypothetical protein
MTEANAASREARAQMIDKLRCAALGLYAQRVEAVERYPEHVDLLMKAGADWFNLLTGAADMLALADEAASQPREGVEALCERVYRAGLNDGWRCNQQGKKSAPIAFDEEWHFYVKNGALAKSIEATLHDTAPTDQAQGGGADLAKRVFLAASRGDHVIGHDVAFQPDTDSFTPAEVAMMQGWWTAWWAAENAEAAPDQEGQG